MDNVVENGKKKFTFGIAIGVAVGMIIYRLVFGS